MRFRKMHGCGNDFVIIDQKYVRGMLTNAQIRHICDRHFGVGCDQLVLLETSQKANIFARFYNADGSESGACGNATRCVAHLVMDEIGQDSCTIETAAGMLACERAGDMITVNMGPAYLDWKDIPLAEEMDTLYLPITLSLNPSPFREREGDPGLNPGEQGEGKTNPTAVGMGNPHCIFFVDNLVDILVSELGATYEHHPLFPEKTNVGFVEVINRSKLRLRTWERGAGMTLACGSNACAAAVAAVRRDLADRQVEVELDGGTLQLEWRESDGHVLMTGPVTYVFDGELKNL